jgi:chromosome segregation ATPase
VFLETLALPTQVDARVARHEELIQERLDEAEAAADRGDTVALAAALAAYQSEVDAATGDIGSDQALLAHLEEELARHAAVLTALAARLPEQSSIEHAIDTSSKAITKLQAKEPPAQPPHPTHAPQGGGGAGGYGGNGGEDGQGQGGH